MSNDGLHILFLAGLAPYRLAFAALAALLVGTAIPLAYAWAARAARRCTSVKIEPVFLPAVDLEQPDAPVRNRKADLLSLLLLLCVTLEYLNSIPWDAAGRFASLGPFRFPRGSGRLDCFRRKDNPRCWNRLGRMFGYRSPWADACALVTAASLVLTLWLLGPILQSALLSG
jgi:hypothetical protein